MHGSEGNRSGNVLMILIVTLLATSVAPSPVSSQTTNFPTGPGLDWNLPTEHHIFLNGTQGNEGLDRIHPPNTGYPGGEVIFPGHGFPVSLVSASTNAATQPTNLKGNLSVDLFAGLEVEDSTTCKATNIIPGGTALLSSQTTFYATVRIGDVTVMDNLPSDSIPMEYDWNKAHKFTITTEIDEMLDVGESITLDVSVVHDCESRPGRLFWGTYDLTSGLIIKADMLTPSLNSTVDQNGIAQIEFTPHSPFGSDDYSNIIIDIIGPLDGWDQGVHYRIMPEEEMRVEHLEFPPHGTRQTDSGSMAWTWVTNNTMKPGMYVMDVCIQTSDGLFDAGLLESTDPPCHIIGVLRFEVIETAGTWVASGWFTIIPILSTLGLIGWFFSTRLPPWPALVVIAILMLSVLGTLVALPDIGPDSQQNEAAAPNFTLLTHGDGKESLGSLTNGKDALVLGVFLAGSPASDLQMEDFSIAKEKLGDSVSFAQLITGDSVEMYDGDTHAMKLNGSWPLLIDESDGAVAKMLPTGIADGVVIIDSAGFIVSWKPASMSPVDLEKSIEIADSGGGRSPFELLSISSLIVMLPLLILGLPRERIEAPEDVLIPAAGWIGTFGAAATGYLVWALPVAILVGAAGAMFWTWLTLALITWMAWQAIAMIIWQIVPEIDFIATKIHSILPGSYRKWRSQKMFTWDMRMGHWFAWLSWIAMPTLLAQGVGSRIAGGGWGYLLGPIFLAFFTIIAGFTTLLFRLVASWGGPISRLGGMLTRPVMVRTWGVFTAGISFWMILWIMTNTLSN